MARPSVIPEVRARLDIYLDELRAAYLTQSEGLRQHTLPTTPDGKVNVRAIAQALGLRPTQEKYLYDRDELKERINELAQLQGVLPIGARLSSDIQLSPLKHRLEQQAQAAQSAVQAAIEAQAAQSELLEQLRLMGAELEALRAENSKLKALVDAMHAGIFINLEP